MKKQPGEIRSTFKECELSIATILQQCSVDAKTGCWNWLGSMTPARGAMQISQPRMYLVISTHTKHNVQVRKWIHEKTEGIAIRKHGVMVLSCCGNEQCVNPEHARAAESVQGIVTQISNGKKLVENMSKQRKKRIVSRDKKPGRPYKEVSQFVPRQRIDAWLHGMVAQ